MSDEIAKVRRHLNDIPDLVVEASHYLVPGTAPKDPDAHYTKGPRLRLPIVAEVFDLLDDRDKDLDDIVLNRRPNICDCGHGPHMHVIGCNRCSDCKRFNPSTERKIGVLPTLGMWVSLTYAELDDMGLNPRECCEHRAHTIVGEAGWLNEYADPIVELHDDFPRDIEHLWTELRKVCRIRKEYVPRCPQCSHSAEAVYGTEEDQYAAWFRCTGCSRTWVLDAEIKRLALTQPPMTLRQIASMLNLSCRDVYGWHDKNRYMPVGTDRRGLKLFELEHVRRVAVAEGRSTA